MEFDDSNNSNTASISQAELFFGESEILTPAKTFVGIFDGVRKVTDQDLKKPME